jgi:hypothetical protein
MYRSTIAAVLTLALLFLSSSSTAVAQAPASELDDLKRAIDAGQPVKFQFKFNSMSPDGQRSSGIYACCGMAAVNMAGGSVILSNGEITFEFEIALPKVTITPDKIVEFTSEPGQASRVKVVALLLNRKRKEEKKTVYLYNPAAVGSGDPSVGGPGATISCLGCDSSMDTLTRLVAWLRTSDRAAPPAAPAAAAAPAKAGMTNDDVIKMAAAGLSEQIITNAIREEQVTTFDVSTAALISLKTAHVPDGAIAAMQEKKLGARSTAQRQKSAADGTVTATQQTAAADPPNPCADLEMMGLYKVDMRPASPLIVYQAKVRNKTSIMRIVTVGWQDYYGEEKQASGQIAAGDIATFNLGPQQPRDRQPINLRVKGCE